MQNYTAHPSRNDLCQMKNNDVRCQNNQSAPTLSLGSKPSSEGGRYHRLYGTNCFIAPYLHPPPNYTKTRWTYCLRVGPTIVKLAMARFRTHPPSALPPSASRCPSRLGNVAGKPCMCSTRQFGICNILAV